MVIWLAVLALAGAPSNSTLVCAHSLPVASGYTDFESQRVSVGRDGCLAAAGRGTAAERGVGLLILAHEASHLAAMDGNECLAERAALRLLPALVARFGGSVRAARRADFALPRAYHSGC